MKQVSLILCLSITLFACDKSRKNIGQVGKKALLSDTAAITETVHGFYKWYLDFKTDTSRQFKFVDDREKHLKLNIAELKKYLAEFRNSGLVSEEFLINEYNFFAECEVQWQGEKRGVVHICLDADKFYCAQDGDFEEFTTAQVNSTIKGDRATALLSFKPNSINGDPLLVELKKERGKWLLARVGCDMGVKFD